MRTASLLALAATLLLGGSDAINLVKPSSAPAVARLGIRRREVANPVTRDRLRRRSSNGTVQETLQNEETLYFANVTMGTPSQSLNLHIDTGSSDLWTNVANSTLCESSGKPCAQSGTYNPDDSSTYKFVSDQFNISYVDGSGAAGDYATDTLTIGGATLTALQFGIGYTSTSQDSILGIGYAINEVQSNRYGEQPYANLPEAMVNQGFIQSNAYSMWLDDLDASTGSILFGGVDSDKYQGDLQTLSIVQEDGVYAEFLITATNISISYNGQTTTLNTDNEDVTVLLDSGSSLTYLPNDMVETIYDQLGVEYSSSEGEGFIDCSMADNSTTLDFTFTSPTISIPMSELVLGASEDAQGEIIEFGGETGSCLFGIAPADSGTNVLGDTFLRSAYVVFDLSNNEISLAQTNFDATSSNILEIGTGTSAVPDASGVAATATSGSHLNSAAKGSAAMVTPMPMGGVIAGVAGAGLLLAM